METIYSTKIVGMGASALTFVNEKMIIFFNKKAQEDLAEYSILLDDGQGSGEIRSGDYLMLGPQAYRVCAVGAVAGSNLERLGHAVVKFDGKEQAELPGNFHVENKPIINIESGLSVSFVRD